MACTLPATGPCTLVADGPCVAPKTYNESLGLIVPSLVQGYDDHFEVEWTIEPVDQTVMLLFRERYGPTFEFPPIEEDHSAGVISSHTGYSIDTVMQYGIRRETATEFGPWYRGFAVCNSVWTSESETVEHLGLVVIHGTDVVIHE